MIPEAWFSLGLSHRQFKTGAAILLHWNPEQPDMCFPSQPTLAAITGILERDVRDDIKELERRGAIEIVKTLGKVNRYKPRTETDPGALRTRGTDKDPSPRSIAVLTPGCETVPLTDHVTDQKTDQRPNAAENETKTKPVAIVSRLDDALEDALDRPAPAGWEVTVSSQADVDRISHLIDHSPGSIPLVLKNEKSGTTHIQPRGISAHSDTQRDLEAIVGIGKVRELPRVSDCCDLVPTPGHQWHRSPHSSVS